MNSRDELAGRDKQDDSSSPTPTRLLYSTAETCELFSIGRTTLYKWLQLGLLRSCRIGGKRLIEGASVREISHLASRETAVSTAGPR